MSTTCGRRSPTSRTALAAVGRNADHGHVFRLIDELLQPLTELHVVVDDDHPYLLFGRPRCSEVPRGDGISALAQVRRFFDLGSPASRTFVGLRSPPVRIKGFAPDHFREARGWEAPKSPIGEIGRSGSHAEVELDVCPASWRSVLPGGISRRRWRPRPPHIVVFNSSVGPTSMRPPAAASALTDSRAASATTMRSAGSGSPVRRSRCAGSRPIPPSTSSAPTVRCARLRWSRSPRVSRRPDRLPPSRPRQYHSRPPSQHGQRGRARHGGRPRPSGPPVGRRRQGLHRARKSRLRTTTGTARTSPGSIGAANNGAGVLWASRRSTRMYAVKVLDSTAWGTWSQIICGIDWVTSTRTDSDPSNDIAVANMSIVGAGTVSGTCSSTTAALAPSDLPLDRARRHLRRRRGQRRQALRRAGRRGSCPPHTLRFSRSPRSATATGWAEPPGPHRAAAPRTPTIPRRRSRTTRPTKPDVRTPSRGPARASARPPGTAGHSTANGTSMAAPHIAGAVALCLGEGAAPRARARG